MNNMQEVVSRRAVRPTFTVVEDKASLASWDKCVFIPLVILPAVSNFNQPFFCRDFSDFILDCIRFNTENFPRFILTLPNFYTVHCFLI